MNLTPSTFVQIEGTTVRYNVNNLAEAKIALKELKLKKKEFALTRLWPFRNRHLADRARADRCHLEIR
jgi:hypothetical protein